MLGPVLTAAIMRAESARARLGVPAGVPADAPVTGGPDGAVPELLDELLVDLRTLLHYQRQLARGEAPELDVLRRGLAPAIREQVQRFAGASDGRLAIDLDMPVDLPLLRQQVETAAYRIVSEALTNVVRHADADWCEVSIELDGDVLRVRVRDNGTSVPVRDRLGVGLRSISQHALSLGGAIDIAPTAPSGLSISVWLPTAGVAEDLPAPA